MSNITVAYTTGGRAWSQSSKIGELAIKMANAPIIKSNSNCPRCSKRLPCIGRKLNHGK